MLITDFQKEQRKYWLYQMAQFEGNFAENSIKMEDEISIEIQTKGIESLLGHLRLCSCIPEKYKHDSTEEKLYSKYTDIVIHEAFKYLGFNSLVLKERADVADVECTSKNYSFVADAKAFRLSRTAKNQKDFKIQSLDKWKYGKPYAILVAPIYQLPTKTSQIYEQAINRSVFIATYTHLAVLVNYAKATNVDKAQKLLLKTLQIIDTLNPSKIAVNYWFSINNVMLGFDKKIRNIWITEKQASAESVSFAKIEGLEFLASERERILNLSKEQAIQEVLRASKINHKIKIIESVKDNGLLDLE